MKSNIAVIGMVKAINNRVSELLAEKLDMYYLDSDAYVSYEYTMSVQDMVNEYDEEFFYRAESKKLRALSDYNNTVIASSPSMLLNVSNSSALKDFAYTIVLTSITKRGAEGVKQAFEADDTLYLRHSLLNNYRVLLKNLETVKKRSADMVIETDGLDTEGITEMILEKFLSFNH